MPFGASMSARFIQGLKWDLRDVFTAFGEVSSASIIEDKFSGESRGFGFVEMSNKEEAEKAIAGLNGKDLKGRPLTVNPLCGIDPDMRP